MTYTYDALNRIKTVTIDWLAATATYNYDDAGRLQSLNGPQGPGLIQFNGSTAGFTYDNANRLTSLANSAGGQIIAGYAYDQLDGNGNRKHVQVTGASQGVNTQTITYAYDSPPLGNRLKGIDSTALTYDDEGQLKTEGGTKFTFDGLHRLTKIGTYSVFSYDGAGRRLSATRNGIKTRYVYDASGNLLVEADRNGAALKYFIYGAGLLAWVDAGTGALYCYHFDGSGNTVAVTDMDQNVVNAYSYDAYGAVTSKNESKPQPFQFAGQFGVMAESHPLYPAGFYYMRARYYDANVGRFISEDPMGLDGGDVNLYAYVQDNPIMGTDPLGLWTFGLDFSGTIGAAFGFTGGVTFVIDSHLNVAVVPHTGGGYLIGAGASAAAQIQVTTADTVYDLAGPGATMSVSVGPTVGVTGGYISGNGYSGVTVGGFVGPKSVYPISAQYTVENSWVYGTGKQSK